MFPSGLTGLLPGAGMEPLGEAGLCLQDLVGGGGGSVQDHSSLHHAHHAHQHVLHAAHDPVAAAVSVSSAITGLMGAPSSLDHHHAASHHASHHEPLEKLKRGECCFSRILFNHTINKSKL